MAEPQQYFCVFISMVNPEEKQQYFHPKYTLWGQLKNNAAPSTAQSVMVPSFELKEALFVGEAPPIRTYHKLYTLQHISHDTIYQYNTFTQSTPTDMVSSNMPIHVNLPFWTGTTKPARLPKLVLIPAYPEATETESGEQNQTNNVLIHNIDKYNKRCLN